jgi:hypothetical protein
VESAAVGATSCRVLTRPPMAHLGRTLGNPEGVVWAITPSDFLGHTPLVVFTTCMATNATPTPREMGIDLETRLPACLTPV